MRSATWSAALSFDVGCLLCRLGKRAVQYNNFDLWFSALRIEIWLVYLSIVSVYAMAYLRH